MAKPNNPYYTFDRDGGIVQIGWPHHQIHEANYFEAQHTWSALADNGTAEMLIVPPADDYLHMTWEANAGGDSLFFLYEAVASAIVTGKSGTAVSAWSVNRQRGAVTGGAKVFYGPEGVSATGTPLVTSAFIAGGTGPFAVGGGIRRNTEWLFSASAAYLMRMVNAGGGAKTAEISLAWYED